jgi:hypothetical protein
MPSCHRPSTKLSKESYDADYWNRWGQIFILDFAKNIGVIHEKVGRFLNISDGIKRQGDEKG